jgi:hypothetical protein
MLRDPLIVSPQLGLNPVRSIKGYRLRPKDTVYGQRIPFTAKGYRLRPKDTVYGQRIPFTAKGYLVLHRTCQLVLDKTGPMLLPIK